jgi:carbamoyl-phosphate synthase large subunit
MNVWPDRTLRVLVWPGGTEIGLEIHRSLAWAKEVELISGGSGGGGHAPYVFESHIDLPHVTDPMWAASLAAAVQRHDIDVIFPAHDDVIVALATLPGGPPARVVGSPAATAITCRSKTLTHNALSGVVPMPALLDLASERLAFPVFARPDRGQGSQGAMVVVDDVDLAFALAHGSDVVTEYLPGRECTIDCFSGTGQGLLYSLARSRDRVRNGISVSSRAVPDQNLFAGLARAIHDALDLRGAWFFQTREDAWGVPHVLEVAPRVAGTMAVSRLRGVNLPLLSLFDSFGVPVQIRDSGRDIRVDRALAERVEPVLKPTRIYVDLDDTLIVRGRVNEALLMALAALRVRRVPIEVVTRHKADPIATLSDFGVSCFFDAVHHLQAGQPKSSVVHDPGGVFIDDSFSERQEVALASGIPVLDCSMLSLLDARRA